MPDVEERFHIDQPARRVWNYFQDIPEVVQCMPGMEYKGQTGEDTHEGRVKVKLGPIAAAFDGMATITGTDHENMRATIEAKGTDRRGGSRAAATVTYEVIPEGGGAAVHLVGDIKLTGALAQMGRTGIVRDVASQLTAEFAECLRARLQAVGTPPAAEAAAEAASAEAPRPREMSALRLVLLIMHRRLRTLLASLGLADRGRNGA